jgi:hypothetical protein
MTNSYTEMESIKPSDLSSVAQNPPNLGDKSNILLELALRELDELFNQENPGRAQQKHLHYLLSLWAYFSIYQLEPELAPEKEKKEIQNTIENSPRIIRLKEGWKILDFADGLITSAGENYVHYSTGPLLKTVNAMVDCLFKRGAKKVIFSGSLPAERFAWLRCKHYGIETCFNPKKEDWQCQTNIEYIRQNSNLPNFSL